AEQAEQVSTTGLVDTKQPKRRQYSEALKRQMVAETQAPGASVSIVARRHDVNSNQLVAMAAAAVAEGGGGTSVGRAGIALREPPSSIRTTTAGRVTTILGYPTDQLAEIG